LGWGESVGREIDLRVAADAWSRVARTFDKPAPWFDGFPTAADPIVTVGIPASVIVHPAGRGDRVSRDVHAPWVSLTAADGPASRLYLSLVAFAQVAMEIDTPVSIELRKRGPAVTTPTDYFLAWSRATDLADESRAFGINLLLGRVDPLASWPRCLTEALDRLRSHHLASPRTRVGPSRDAPGGRAVTATQEVRIDLWTGQSNLSYVVERPIKFPARGYNSPKAIPVPLGFFTNGWCAKLTGKQTHSLLALLFQFARQPKRPGHFLGTAERDFLGIVDKSYQRSLVSLVGEGFLTPLDLERFNDRRGKGARHDKPHEFIINFETFLRPAWSEIAPAPQ
jgi:hypothetical protein